MDGLVLKYYGILFSNALGNAPSWCYVKVLLFIGLFLSPCSFCYDNAL